MFLECQVCQFGYFWRCEIDNGFSITVLGQILDTLLALSLNLDMGSARLASVGLIQTWRFYRTTRKRLKFTSIIRIMPWQLKLMSVVGYRCLEILALQQYAGFPLDFRWFWPSETPTTSRPFRLYFANRVLSLFFSTVKITLR